MTDTTLNRFVAQGTAVQRAAFTPSPPTPASGPASGYYWFETDTGNLYAWNTGTTAWVSIAGGGGGGGSTILRAGSHTSVSSDPNSATGNIIAGCTLSFAASASPRVYAVYAYASWIGHNIACTINMDGTSYNTGTDVAGIAPNGVANQDGSVISAASSCHIGPVLFTIPGDNATHTINFCGSDRGSAGAVTFYDRWLMMIPTV